MRELRRNLVSAMAVWGGKCASWRGDMRAKKVGRGRGRICSQNSSKRLESVMNLWGRAMDTAERRERRRERRFRDGDPPRRSEGLGRLLVELDGLSEGKLS